MPLNIDFLQVLLHMFNFVILVGALGFLLYNPVCKFMAERKEHFENLEKENAEAKAENEKLKDEYEKKLKQAQSEIEELKTTAQQEAADSARLYLDAAQRKASHIVSSAEKDAERRRETILDSTQTEVSELVLSATQKLLNDTSTPERDSALYDEFIRLNEETAADKRES